MACRRRIVTVFEMALCWIVFALVVAARELEATSEQSIATSRIAAHYGKNMEGCREEAQLTHDMVQEWPQIWDYNFNSDRREIGCVIICMSNKLSLLNNDHQMKNEDLTNFAMSFGLDNAVASTIVDTYKNCEIQSNDIEDGCSRVNKVYACFKAAMKKAGIAPYADLIRDVMNEI